MGMIKNFNPIAKPTATATIANDINASIALLATNPPGLNLKLNIGILETIRKQQPPVIA